MKVATVIGARPQFIKASPVSSALSRAGHDEQLIHTGQHYDANMSTVFFDELGLASPAVNLGVGSRGAGAQVGEMLIELEAHLRSARPDLVLVYGDTNSTLAGALAANKLGIPLAHVESGLRSYNRAMPEEHNRVVTDHLADVLFCPTQTAIRNLASEGLQGRACLVGDTMLDALDAFREHIENRRSALSAFGVAPSRYLLATIHRPYNTDDEQVLATILDALGQLNEPVLFPVHPRTRARLSNIPIASNILPIDPVGYVDMLMLERFARVIATDSGGVQKEAYFFGVPCVTLRPETEWTETLIGGWNELVAIDSAAIVDALKKNRLPTAPRDGFGDGRAAERIVESLAAAYA